MKIFNKRNLFISITCGFLAFLFLFTDNLSNYSHRRIYKLIWHTQIIPNWIEGLNYEEAEVRIIIPKHDDLRELRDFCMTLDSTIPLNVKREKFKGRVSYNDKEGKASFYLMGQNKDHMMFRNKWSLKINSKIEINGLRKIKLMVPEARSTPPINEYICHMLAENEGLINLEYDFIKATINDEYTGIYVVEERFSDALFERYKIESGLIFQGDKLKMEYNISETESKQVQATWATFLNGEIPVDSIFDINSLAKHYAIADLADGQHCHWQYNSFYLYDAKTAKITPVPREWASPHSQYMPSGKFDLFYLSPDIDSAHHKVFLNDSVFLKAYIQHLKRISTQEYLDDFYTKYDSAIIEQLKRLKWEYYLLKDDPHYLYGHINQIQEILISQDQ